MTGNSQNEVRAGEKKRKGKDIMNLDKCNKNIKDNRAIENRERNTTTKK